MVNTQYSAEGFYTDWDLFIPTQGGGIHAFIRMFHCDGSIRVTCKDKLEPIGGQYIRWFDQAEDFTDWVDRIEKPSIFVRI